MSNSALVNYTKLSPNHSGRRNHVIDTVSIHCMAGNLTVESCGNLFAKASAKASSNYGIGSDGRIALYVEEANRSWCTSSSANDNRAVTIEVANTSNKEPFPVSDAAYHSLIALLADICRRNGIPALRWQGDKSLIGKVDKQNMTVHRWFANKSCPGQWLYEHHGQIANDVNALLNRSTESNQSTQSTQSTVNLGTAPKVIKATEPAHYHDDSLKGRYTVTASALNVRNGAGTTKKVLTTIKQGESVLCEGYFNEVDGVKWLYVWFIQGNVTYNAFVSAQYLKRSE